MISVGVPQLALTLKLIRSLYDFSAPQPAQLLSLLNDF
jgi:hypothetical protein